MKQLTKKDYENKKWSREEILEAWPFLSYEAYEHGWQQLQNREQKKKDGPRFQAIEYVRLKKALARLRK